MKKEKSYKLNIFEVLKNIDNQNINFYDSLTEEQKNAFQPYVVMRWLSGTNNKQQIVYLNEFLNPYVFNLKDKKLLYYLMVVNNFSSGREKYNYIKTTYSGTNKSKKVKIISEYHNISTRKAEEVVDIFNKEDILEMASEMGYSDAELKNLKKSL